MQVIVLHHTKAAILAYAADLDAVQAVGSAMLEAFEHPMDIGIIVVPFDVKPEDVRFWAKRAISFDRSDLPKAQAVRAVRLDFDRRRDEGLAHLIKYAADQQ